MSFDLIAHQMTLNHFVLQRNVRDVSHEESLRRPDAGGNCINWVVGHLVSARNSALGVLDAEPVFPAERTAPYERKQSGDLDASTAVPLEELLAAFSRAQETIVNGLKRLDPERASSPALFSPTNNPNETVGTLLAGLAFHEAYHAGQTGVLRRVLGKPGALA